MNWLNRFSVVLCFAAILAGCQRHPQPESPRSTLPTAAVRVQTVEAKTQVITEEAVGTVRAKLQARLEAKISGRIQEMRVVPGQLVKAGELLASLDVQEIRARLDQALATHQQTDSDLKRFTALLERATVTQAEFEAVQARARVAGAAVKEAETMLSYAEVVAPFDGVITRKLADVGDLAAPGKPLLEMEDPAGLRLEADIPEAMISGVRLGAAMAVRASITNAPLRAVVSEIAPSADPNSRTFRVKFDLPADSSLRAGQFGRVAVPVAETTRLRVPVAALVERGQMRMVFVEEGQRAVMRLVKAGKQIGDEVEIASGLSAGDRVVVENAASLSDGQPLDLQP